MTSLLNLFAIVLIGLTIISLSSKKKSGSNRINSFKSKFKKSNRLREIAQTDMANHLMNDPSLNINISGHESEPELREKADIHRARLQRYGKSKMNGEMLFLGPRGGIFRYTFNGSKKYI